MRTKYALPPEPPAPPPGRRVVDGALPEGGFIALVMFALLLGGLLGADIWLLSKLVP